MDIGETSSNYKTIPGKELKTNEQNVLNSMYRIRDPEQVSRSRIEFPFQWIVEKTFNEELPRSWDGA